jgi:secondary thiamine-phosphate synthase enzyme
MAPSQTRMRQYQSEITRRTSGQGLYEITAEVSQAAALAGIASGLVTLFCRHTSCSLLVNENADPDVRRDLEAFLQRLVPEGDPLFVHTAEGPDDMPAHIKTALTTTSLSIPVMERRLTLGTWQGIYLFEHRTAPHARRIVVHVIGE